jgi:hypothetical protein
MNAAGMVPDGCRSGAPDRGRGSGADWARLSSYEGSGLPGLTILPAERISPTRLVHHHRGNVADM